MTNPGHEISANVACLCRVTSRECVNLGRGSLFSGDRATQDGLIAFSRRRLVSLVPALSEPQPLAVPMDLHGFGARRAA
jgi:hypothetical protein